MLPCNGVSSSKELITTIQYSTHQRPLRGVSIRYGGNTLKVSEERLKPLAQSGNRWSFNLSLQGFRSIAKCFSAGSVCVDQAGKQRAREKRRPFVFRRLKRQQQRR